MPILTKLSTQIKNPTRINIFIDGKYSFSLPADVVLTRSLKKDQALSQSELEDLMQESELDKILSKLGNFISYRPRSEKEVRDRLYRYTRDLDSDHISKLAMTRVQSAGLINDASFAEWFVTQRMTHRPRSRRELQAELFKKGISKSLIEDAFHASGYDETDALKTIIAKRTRSARPSATKKQKLFQYLARRGFSYPLIKQVLGEISNSN